MSGDPATRGLTAFIASAGYEATLVEELQPRARPLRWPAVVALAQEVEADPIFARQVLPGAALVKAPSVRALAEAAFVEIEGAVDAAADGFTLQAFVPDPQGYAALEGRADLVGQELRGLLRERRRRAFRGLVAEATLSARILVVQLALVARTSLLVSAARPRALPLGGWNVAPWPAGIAPVAEDRSAPSRAYGKLEEGLAWLGAAPGPGERCVDLGGAPGGWAWTALRRGAEVVAVDRAPLAPAVAAHPALTVVRGDAFRYQPPAAVDWLLCDVICEPARTLELVETWMQRRWARRLVATVKFRGREGYGVLEAGVKRLAALGPRLLRVKHLYRHHNEVAVLIER